jgi:cardiolipin synthase
VALIKDARRELLVASYGLAADHVAVRAVVEAAKRGVRVTVLTRPRRAVAAGVAVLASAGVSVVGHDKLHAKALVVDGQALVMSANLEAQGLDQGFEVGAVLSGSVARGVEETLREWAAAFPWVYRADATRGDHLGDFCPVKAGLRDGVVKVTESYAQKVTEVIAPDALALDDAPAPALTPVAPRGALPRRVTFAWDVIPPSLPKGATERLRDVEREEPGKDGKPKKTTTRIPHDPRVFDHGGSVYVVLDGSTDAERARQAARTFGATVVLR